MYEPFYVILRLKGLSKDGSKFHLVNDITKTNGAKAALITSEACWFDLKKRKITAPPDSLFKIMQQMEKTTDFYELTCNCKRNSEGKTY